MQVNSSACRRRLTGSNARPKRVSNKVMLVIQMDSAGCRSSHSVTAVSGTVRINAPSTLVSRIITDRISSIGESDRAIPVALSVRPNFANRVAMREPSLAIVVFCSLTASRKMLRSRPPCCVRGGPARRFNRAFTEIF